MTALARAAELAPQTPRYGYVYAIALQSAGKVGRALQVLEATHKRAPRDIDTLYALVTINRDAGDRAKALHYAKTALSESLKPNIVEFQ